MPSVGLRGGSCQTRHQIQRLRDGLFLSSPSERCQRSWCYAHPTFLSTPFSAGRSISEGARCLVAVKSVAGEGKRDTGHCTAESSLFWPDISTQLVHGFKSVFFTDFCLESSRTSYMPLKGLSLLLPFIALLLVIVLPQDCLQEGIQRALPIFLFYFSFPFAFNARTHIFLHPLPRFLLFVLLPAFFCCDKPAEACLEPRQQPRCARHLGRADPAACWSLQSRRECGRWTTATPSPPGFPLCPVCVAFPLPSQQRLLHLLSVCPTGEVPRSSRGSSPSAGKPCPDGVTPSPPSSAPCGTREDARKIWRILKLSVTTLPTFNSFATEIH